MSFARQTSIEHHSLKIEIVIPALTAPDREGTTWPATTQ